MAYIGKTPTAAPLTSSDVADGIISTAKIADTAITNAKLNADIISADTALGAEPADTDELLVSDAGTLKRMDYSHIKASSPGLVKIQSTTLGSAASEIDFDFTASDYRVHLFVIHEMAPATDNVQPCLRVKMNDAIYAPGSNEYGVHSEAGQQDSTQFLLSNDGVGNNTSGSVIYEDYSGHFYLVGHEVNRRVRIWGGASHGNNGSTKKGYAYGGGINSSETYVVQGVRLFFSSGNVNSCTFTHYGVTN